MDGSINMKKLLTSLLIMTSATAAAYETRVGGGINYGHNSFNEDHPSFFIDSEIRINKNLGFVLAGEYINTSEIECSGCKPISLKGSSLNALVKAIIPIGNSSGWYTTGGVGIGQQTTSMDGGGMPDATGTMERYGFRYWL